MPSLVCSDFALHFALHFCAFPFCPLFFRSFSAFFLFCVPVFLSRFYPLLHSIFVLPFASRFGVTSGIPFAFSFASLYSFCLCLSFRVPFCVQCLRFLLRSFFTLPIMFHCCVLFVFSFAFHLCVPFYVVFQRSFCISLFFLN